MKVREPVLTGGCQCGAVRYALYDMPGEFNICHCRMCQKAVGGPFAALVPNQANDFAWTKGTPGTFASSNIARRDFCRDCGTPLTYRGPSGRVIVTYGSLDNPGAVSPKKQFGMEGRRDWIDHLGELPGVRTDQDLTKEQLAAMVNNQWPDGEA
jgi:hypothetical protein